jgi:hypothetical protein
MKKLIIALIILLPLIIGAIWAWKSKNESPAKTIVTYISAYNATKDMDATVAEAYPRDVIDFTLVAENWSDHAVADYITQIEVGGVTAASILLDTQGANYNSTRKTLFWAPVEIPPEGFVEKKFSVEVKDILPEGSEYILAAEYNNRIAINIAKGQVAGAILAEGASFTPVALAQVSGSNDSSNQTLSQNSGQSALNTNDNISQQQAGAVETGQALSAPRSGPTVLPSFVSGFFAVLITFWFKSNRSQALKSGLS